MNSNLKAVAGIVLASAAVAQAHSADAPAAAKTTHHHVRSTHKAKPTLQSEIEALRTSMAAQQSQIQALQTQLSARDAQMQQVQQQSQAAVQQANQQAQEAAASQQAVTAQNQETVSNLQTAVTGLQDKNTAIVHQVSQVQSESAKKSELSDLAFGKVKIGALFYGDWAYYTDTGFGPQFLTQLNQDGPGNGGFNTFDVTRAYINLLYTPDEAVTLRITPNVYRQVGNSTAISNGTGSAIATSTNGNLSYRLKYAYVDLNTLFKGSATFGKDKVRAGQGMNPLIDWEENLYGYRFVNLTPWNYLSLSSTYTGVALLGPIKIHNREYLDYQIGAYDTASFHSIETNDKKQVMGRLTWYPFGAKEDRTGLGLTAFENYGYNTKTPDAKSTPLNRLALLAHYQSPSHAYLIAGEYDLGRNAFSAGNLFSGAEPGDAVGLGPTGYAPFSALASALLGGDRTRQQGFDAFGHAKLGHSNFALFGMYQYFQPNTRISGTNPIDFERTVGGLSYTFNKHFELAVDDQNLDYYHSQFTMAPGQISTFSSSLLKSYPAGITNAVPDGTNAFFTNLQFSY